MATERQIKANRRNATQSTGPTSDQGKATSSQNAVKHGLRAAAPLVRGESPDEFHEFRKQLEADLRPVEILENMLVARITSILWRLKRVDYLEAGVLELNHHDAAVSSIRDEKLERTSDVLDVLSSLQNPDTPIGRTMETIRCETQTRLKSAAEAKNVELSELGQAFTRDAFGADCYTRLSRYETALERSLYRAIHEMQRLQVARLGAPLPPPAPEGIVVSSDAG